MFWASHTFRSAHPMRLWLNGSRISVLRLTVSSCRLQSHLQDSRMQPSLKKMTMKDQGFKKESLQCRHENLKQSRPTSKFENELQRV